MRRDDGMTLVELVMIITILSVIAFVMVPKFDAATDVELSSAVKQLAGDLKFAQSKAITTRTRYGISFNTTQETYTIYVGTPATPVDDFMAPGRAMRRSWDRVTLGSVNFDGGAVVEFNSMGTPYNSSGNELLTDGVVVLASGASVDSVFVLPLTGRVRF